MNSTAPSLNANNCPSSADHQSDLLCFTAWWLLVMAGFAYVAVVLCGREDFWQSGNPGVGDFLVVIGSAAILYWLGPRQNWPPAKLSAGTILRWNGLGYVLPFFLALHWEYLGKLLGVHFSLRSADLGGLAGRSLVVLIGAGVLVAGLLACHLLWAARAGMLRPYVAALLGVPSVVALVTYLQWQTHTLHVHHYCVGVYLFPFFRFRHAASLVAQAFFLGMAVEGISRWGMDPLWYAWLG